MKKNIIKGIVFLIFVVFFFLFLKDCITNISYGDIEGRGTSYRMYYVIGFLLVSFIYLVFAERLAKLKLDRTIVCYILFIIVLSLFYAITISPLRGLSSYLLLIAPLIIFLFVRNIVITLYDNKLCTFISYALFLALSITYFIKFNQLSLMEIEYHNIYSYVILLLLPVVLCTSNSKVKIISILITGLIIITSFKRGGLMAFIFGFAFYLRISFKRANKNGFWSWLSFLLIIVALVFVLVRYDSLAGNIMSERLLDQEGDYSSGRLELYQITMQMIANASVKGLVLGHGYNAVLNNSYLQLAAHNDFLEILYDYGLFGFMSFLIMCIQMIKRAHDLIKSNSSYAAEFTYAVIIFLVLSSISTIIRIPIFMLCTAYTFGYLNGKTYEHK